MTKTEPAPPLVEELSRAVRAFNAAEKRRDEAIYRAHKSGMSLRAIAQVTGLWYEETSLSHETVRVIVARVERWVEAEAAWFEGHDEHGPGLPYNARDQANLRRRRAHLDFVRHFDALAPVSTSRKK